MLNLTSEILTTAARTAPGCEEQDFSWSQWTRAGWMSTQLLTGDDKLHAYEIGQAIIRAIPGTMYLVTENRLHAGLGYLASAVVRHRNRLSLGS